MVLGVRRKSGYSSNRPYPEKQTQKLRSDLKNGCFNASAAVNRRSGEITKQPETRS